MILHIFANPTGGAERLSHIDHLCSKYIAPSSIWFVDSAESYRAWALDNPEHNVVLCRVNHKEAKDHGFVWHLLITPEIEVQISYRLGRKYIYV